MKRLLFLLALVCVSTYGQNGQGQNTARMLSGTNVVTTCPYTIQATDQTKLLVINTATSCAVSLPAATTANFGAGAIFSVKSQGSGTVTITPVSGNISGNPSLSLTSGQGADIYSDGANYQAQQGAGTGSGGSPGSPANSPQCNNGGTAFRACTLNSNVMYVSPSGNDSNSGLAWDTAKFTVYAALEALPGGTTGTYGQGTIYVADGSTANPTSGAGIWLMGPSDPNFSSPPAGWLKQAVSYATVTIIGVPVQNAGPNAHKNRANLTAGSPSGTTHPGMWISAVGAPVVVQNIAFVASGGTGRGIVIGECSDGTRTGTCSTPGHAFENVAASAANFAGEGPGIDITGNSYWLWFSEMSVGGNAITATGGRTANNAAAILIDGTGNGSDGLIYIRDSNLATGGIKVIPGTTTPGVYHFQNITEEGDFVHDMPPVVWFTAGLPPSGVLEQINSADPGPTATPVVQNDAGAWGLVMSDINGTAPPTGGGVVLSQYLANLQNSTVSPKSQGQVGFFDGYVVGETDVARRIAGLSNNRFTNSANNNTATWTTTAFAGSSTITTGQSDPYGGTLAAKVSSSAGTTETAQLGACASYTTNAGDWIVGGVWVQGMSPASASVALACSGFGSPTFTATNSANGMIVGASTDWQFRWVAGKISAASTATKLGLQVAFSNTLTPTLYGPVFYIIPAGTISDNEVQEMAAAMNSVDNACPAGSTCNVTGHPLNIDQITIRNCVVTGQPLIATNGSPMSCVSPGIQDGNTGSAVTSTPYTIQCDSGTTLIDRAHLLRFQSGASVVTVPLSTASGCTAGFVVSVADDGAGTLTFNRTSPDTFSIFDGNTNTDSATSFTLTNGQHATLNQGATGIWEVRKGGGGAAGTQVAPNLLNWYFSPDCGTQTNCTTIHDDGVILTDCTTANTSSTITCPDGIFVAGDVGKTAWVGTQGTGLTLGLPGITATIACPISTIATVNSTTSITLTASNDCTAALTGTGVLVFGTKDGTTIKNAMAATAANFIFPAGSARIPYAQPRILIDQPFGNTLASGANAPFISISGSTPTVSSVLFIMTPDFNWSGCTGNNGVISNVCFGAQSINMNYMSFTGMGLNGTGTCPAAAQNKVVVGPLAIDNQSWYLNLNGICVGTAGLEGYELDGADEMVAYGGAEVGQFSCVINGIGDAQYYNDCLNDGATVTGNSCSSGLGLCAGLWVKPGGQLQDFGSVWLENALNQGSMQSRASHFYGSANSYALINSDCSGAAPKFVADGDFYNESSSPAGSTAFGINTDCGGQTYLHNSTIKAGASGTALALSNDGTAPALFDQCGNTYSGGTVLSNPNNFLIVGSGCSANQALVTAPKLVLSGGWGSTAAVSALSGTNAPIKFTITNSGTGQGASPTITYTFPAAYLVAPFSCTATQIGGTNTAGTFTSSTPSTTAVTFTFSLTPTASNTEIVQVTCVTP